MKTKIFTTGKFLAASAAGALMLTGVAAQADTVTFTPGTSTATPSGLVDLTSGPSFAITSMNWLAVNNDFSHTWNVLQDGGDSSRFTETFTFLLQTTTPFARFGDASSPQDIPFTPTNTYVTMVVDVAGFYNGGFNPLNDNPLDTNLVYDTGTFTMFFHEDGVATNCSVACGGTQIAVFDVLDGTALRSSGGSGNRTDLFWNLELDLDTNLAFTDENGDAFDPAEQIVLAVTNQQTRATSADGDTTVVLESVNEPQIPGDTTFTVESVPEPGVLGLFGIGLLGLGIAANRRKQRVAA